MVSIDRSKPGFPVAKKFGMVDKKPSPFPTHLPNEAELLSRINQHGDHKALTEIITFYRNYVFRIAIFICNSPTEAEDITQETFIAMIQSLGKIDQAKGGLRKWLGAVAAINSRKNYRTKTRRNRRENRVAAQSETMSWDREPLSEEERTDQVVRNEMMALPDRFRIPITLRYFNNAQIKDIAEQLNVHEKTVSRNMQLGLEKLRKRLKAAGVTATAATIPSLLSFPGFTPQLSNSAGESTVQVCLELFANNTAEAAENHFTNHFPGHKQVTVFTAVVLVAVFLIYNFMDPSNSTTEPDLDSWYTTNKASVPEAKPQADSFPDTFLNFESGIPDNADIVSGHWSILPAWGRMNPCLAALPGQPTIIRLPGTVNPKHFIQIQISHRGPIHERPMDIAAAPGNNEKIFGYKTKPNPNYSFEKNSSNANNYSLIIHKNYIILQNANELIQIAKYEGSEDPLAIYLAFKNIYVTEIVAHSTSPEKIPNSIKNPDAVWEQFRVATIAVLPMIPQPSPAPSIDKTWTFQEDSPSELKVVSGSWKHYKKQSCMKVSPTQPTIVAFPENKYFQPFVIQASYKLGKKRAAATQAFSWADGANMEIALSNNKNRKLYRMHPTEPTVFNYWVAGNYCIFQAEGMDPHGATVFKKPFPKPTPVLKWLNLLVYKIQIKEVSWEEIQKRFPNPEKY